MDHKNQDILKALNISDEEMNNALDIVKKNYEKEYPSKSEFIVESIKDIAKDSLGTINNPSNYEKLLFLAGSAAGMQQVLSRLMEIAKESNLPKSSIEQLENYFKNKKK